MRRPLMWMIIPVALYSILGAVLHIHFIILLITSVIIFSFTFSHIKSEYIKKYIIILSIFSYISLIVISINSAPKPLLSRLDSGEITAQISGRIKKINVYDDTAYMQLKSVNVGTEGENTHLHGILLKCPANEEAGLGDLIISEGKLSALSKARNEGNFDEKSYYESIGIEAVFKSKESIRIREKGNFYYRTADMIRKHFKASFELVSPLHKGELSSVIIGDKSELDSDIKQLYTDNGIAHILAISGLHISFAGVMLYKLLRRMGTGIPAAVSISAAAVIGYVLLTGGSISAWRACVMFIFAAVADILGRSYDPLSALSLQASVTLLLIPKACIGASFIMSYTAVLSIILAGEGFGNALYKLKGNLTFLRIILSDCICSVSVFAFMLPVNLYFYNSIPIYSILINMLIIPLSSVLMPLGMAAGFFGRLFLPAGIFFAGGAERIFELYEVICRFALSLPFNRITPGRPALFVVALFYIFVGLSFYLWKKYLEGGVKKILGDPGSGMGELLEYFKQRLFVIAFALVPVISTASLMLVPRKDSFYLSMLCVGQGDCIFVHTDEGKNLLFDGGSSNVRDVYKKRIKPFLLSRGINRLDAVFVSHTDADHVNGLTQLLNECDGLREARGNIKVASLVLPSVNEALRDDFYTELEANAAKKGIVTEYASEGMNIRGGDFELICLSPQAGEADTDKNTLSAVYKLKTKDISVLFTGDMTEKSERRLLAKNTDISADILKVAHHGSNYSSCAEFLRAVSPKAGIISCGENTYGHPGADTLERFKTIAVPVFVTKENAQIFIEKKGRDYKIRTLL